jgi:hypothetical protein
MFPKTLIVTQAVRERLSFLKAFSSKEVKANPGCPGLVTVQLPTILNGVGCYKPLVPKNVAWGKNVKALRGGAGHDAVDTDIW